MSQRSSSGSASKSGLSHLLILSLVLFAVLGWLFAPSFRDGWTLFLNDGPLGALKADYNKTPGAFFGVWQDLNWVGSHGGSLLPSFTFGQFLALGPIGYSKFHALVALFGLGICTWFSCRLIGFNSYVGLLTALAAALNMNVFSNACWGLSSRPWALATSLLAVGAISAQSSVSIWLRCALAGLAVGMGITEGADVGIIFSVFIGFYAFTHAVASSPKPANGVGKGIAQTIVIALFAGFMSYHIINALVFQAKVVDAVESQKQAMSPDQQWDWATQWSLPKAETLRVVIPGLHGYRMDTPEGGRYWGTAGRDPHWEVTHQGFPRFSGAGEYAGVTVVLIAAFALFQSRRRQGNVYSKLEQRLILFWAAVIFISLLFAWGRFAPFYRVVFALPGFSNFRNPIKWTHPMHLGILMLFAYGLEGLWRGYLRGTPIRQRFGEFLSKASGFDKRWIWGCAAVVFLSGVGWLGYLSSGGSLARYLMANAVADPREPVESVVKEIVHFSQMEVGIYLLVLILSVGLVLAAMAGRLSASNGRWLAVSLGLLLAVDLARANRPWVQHYDYVAKYANNPMLEFLKSQPGHPRVTVVPFGGKGAEALQMLQYVYGREWMQQQFQFYNIPSIDIIQDPRPLPENVAFRETLMRSNIVRLWELTSTRYIFGLAGEFSDIMNRQLDPKLSRFKTVLPFELSQSGDGTFGVQTNASGPYAVLEFSGALSRATLFTQWEYSQKDDATLQRLVDPSFIPSERVIVSGTGTNSPAPSATPATGKAEITSYAPKQIVVKTDSANDGVLALTDKFNSDWRVFVDGSPAQMLRCNFLMRGVQVPKGSHSVEFRFEPSTTGLYVSLAAIGTAVVLCGVLVFTTRKSNLAA